MSSSRAPEGTSSRSLHYFQLPSDLKWNTGGSSNAHPHRRSAAQRHPPANSTPPPPPLRRQHSDSGAASEAATPVPPSSNSSRGKSPMQVNDQSSPTKPEANLLMQMSRHASIELADDEDETLRSIKRVVTESRRSNNQKNNSSSSSKKGLVINPSSTSSTPTSVAKKSKVVPPPKEPLKDGSAVKKPKLLIKIANKDKKQEPNNNNNSSSPKIEKSTNTVNGGGEDGPMNEKAVVAVDEDYDGKIWNLRPRRANVRKGQNDVVTAAAASNPEKNGKANCRSGEKEEDQKKGGAAAAAAAAGGGGEKKEKKEKISFSVSLTKKEIEEDIYAMTGGKPSRRPRKRAKNVQKQLDVIFPGLYLG